MITAAFYPPINTRLEFFLAAMRAGLFKQRAWVFSAFSLIQENLDAWKGNAYPYRLVQTPTGVFYVDPGNGLQLTKLPDTIVGMPPFGFKERIQLKAGDVPHLTVDGETNYGNLLTNWTLLAYPFGKKIPYIFGHFMPDQLEGLVIARLRDTPIDASLRNEQDIYVDELLEFTNSCFYLAGFSSLCVPAGTKKGMIQPEGVVEYRNKLLAEIADRLHDPEAIAGVAKKLQEYDKEWLKGDDALNFLINKKSFEVVRARKFLMHGAEVGLSEGVNVDLIQNSLIEGWDINKFPTMNNSLRAGSFNRGAQTMLGGESVKWLLRGSSNINITDDDCGSNLGVAVTLTPKNKNRYVNFHIVTAGGVVQLTLETIDQWLGHEVIVRSPMYCWLDKTDYCKCCVGPRLAENPTGASAAIADYGSAFMAIYMKSVHGKALTTARMNYKEQLF